jgi:vacuolar-type H+-ATPase subunit I/STV1
MSFFKFILLLIGIGLGIYLFFWLFFGIVSTLLWYAFWLGLIGLGGYVGYKLFLEKDDEQPRLSEKKPTAISEMQNLDRVLEEFKQKELK